MRTAAAVVGVIAVAAMASANSATACGCGIALHTRATNERALITYRSGTETIIPSLTLSHVGHNAAVLFPVPGRPHVRALDHVDHLFDELELATPTRDQDGGVAVGAAAPAAPKVLSSRVIGGYRVSVLEATSAAGLASWLRTHHYSPPPGSRPILAGYVARGWRFVAIRLAGTAAGATKPLAISFESSRIVYPERLSVLSPDPVDLELFVDASGPVHSHGIPGLAAAARYRVADLHPAPSPAVRALLPAPWLTRLEATQLPPSEIRSDIAIVVPRVDGGGGSPAESSGIGPVTIVLLSLVAAALVAAAVVAVRAPARRRRTSA